MSKAIEDILTSIETDSPVIEVRACIFWTAVVSRRCGLASTLRESGPHHGRKPVPEAGSLTRKTARELALFAQSDSLPQASIGVAALNSVLEIDENRCVEANAFEMLQKKGIGKRIAIVGSFPFIPKLRELASDLWVLERKPGQDELPDSEAERVLPQADVVGMTGTTLINHSFERLISLCQKSFVVMLGPSTPLSPVLFDYGVDVLSGIKVTEPGIVLRRIGEGATFRQIEGVRLLTMSR